MICRTWSLTFLLAVPKQWNQIGSALAGGGAEEIRRALLRARTRQKATELLLNCQAGVGDVSLQHYPPSSSTYNCSLWQ